MKYIAFLRAVNVGGHNKINMKELKAVLESTGFAGVSTYIQSGNIIFESEHIDLEKIISEVIKEHWELDIKTIVRSVSELEEIIAKNTFNEEKLYITMLSESPADDLVQQIIDIAGKGDEFIVNQNNVYICANGPYHKTVFSNSFFEKKLHVAATTRNLKTLRELIRLSQ